MCLQYKKHWIGLSSAWPVKVNICSIVVLSLNKVLYTACMHAKDSMAVLLLYWLISLSGQSLSRQANDWDDFWKPQWSSSPLLMRLVLAMLVFYSTYQFINMAQPMPPTPTTPGAPVNWPIPVLDEGQEYHCFIAYSFKEQEIGKFITYSFHHKVSLIKMLTWSWYIGYTKQFL